MYSDTAVSASVCHTHTQCVGLSCTAEDVDGKKREVSKPQCESHQMPDMHKQVLALKVAKTEPAAHCWTVRLRERLSL